MLINFLRCDETPDSGQIAPHFRLHVFAAMVSVTNCDVSGDQILRANRIFNNIAFSASKTQKYMVKDRWQSICGSCTAVASSCPWVPGTPSETLSASPECPEWSYRWYKLLQCKSKPPSASAAALCPCWWCPRRRLPATPPSDVWAMFDDGEYNIRRRAH